MMFIIVLPDQNKPKATDEELEAWYQSILNELKSNGYSSEVQ